MDILTIANLKKRFGDKVVLDGVSLSVPKKSVFGFIGKNGAGKTTTMKAVLGLLEADEGEIYVAGERVTYGQTGTNKYIGYLPDVPEFYDFMTANEYLQFCGEMAGMRKEEIKERCEEMLKLVGLSEEKHRIKGFSRGMKQRLGIAQALLGRPKLLICDEPTSALDPVGRKEILDILMAVKEETTVIFSTHILSDVERICTDVAFLNDGKIIMQGKMDEIKEKNKSEDMILEFEKEEEAKRLKKAQEETRALVQVGHVVRFMDAYQYLKELVSEGTYGKVIAGNFGRISPRPMWMKGHDDMDRTGTMALDMHIHDVDFIRYLIGQEPENMRSWAVRDKEGIVQHIWTSYSFGDALLTAECSWDYPVSLPFMQTFRVRLERAAIMLDAVGILTVYPEEGDPFVPQLGAKEEMDLGINVSDLVPYMNEMGYFVENIQAGKEGIGSLSEAIASFRLVWKELKLAGVV